MSFAFGNRFPCAVFFSFFLSDLPPPRRCPKKVQGSGGNPLTPKELHSVRSIACSLLEPSESGWKSRFARCIAGLASRSSKTGQQSEGTEAPQFKLRLALFGKSESVVASVMAPCPSVSDTHTHTRYVM